MAVVVPLLEPFEGVVEVDEIPLLLFPFCTVVEVSDDDWGCR